MAAVKSHSKTSNSHLLQPRPPRLLRPPLHLVFRILADAADWVKAVVGARRWGVFSRPKGFRQKPNKGKEKVESKFFIVQ